MLSYLTTFNLLVKCSGKSKQFGMQQANKAYYSQLAFGYIKYPQKKTPNLAQPSNLNFKTA